MDEILFKDFLSKYLLLKRQTSYYKTGYDLRLNILKNIANYLNLNLDSGICTNSSFIHPDLIALIDNKWKEILQRNFQISQDELNIIFRLKYERSLTNKNLIKLIEFLANNDYILRDRTEKILKSNFLVSLLAVDGFLGYTFNDLINYVSHLKTENNNKVINLHIQIIRQLYNKSYLKKLSGTDASAVIFLVLLKMYAQFVKKSKYIEVWKNDVDHYLLKNSKIYSDINVARENENDIIYFYKLNMNNISMIANIKINQLLVQYQEN